MNNPEKLATYGTHDEEKENKNTRIVCMRESQRISQHGTQNVKTHKRTIQKT